MAAGKKGTPARPKPVIDVTVCTGCSLCIENCPANCLALGKAEGVVQEVAALSQPEKCIGCGVCRDSCPIGALEMLLPDGTKVEQKDSLKEDYTMANKLFTLGCRAFQYTMKGGNYVLGYREPELIKGAGSLAGLPDFLGRKQAQLVCEQDSGQIRFSF